MAAEKSSSVTASLTKSTPKDALVMQAILKDMNINDYEPRVVNQMLEFTYSMYLPVYDDVLSGGPIGANSVLF